MSEVRRLAPASRPPAADGGESGAVRRLLLELHDGPMQLLYAALLQVELLHASLPGDGEPAHRASQVKSLVERASMELRGIIDEGGERTAETADLLSLLRGVAARHQSATETRVRFVARERLPDPGPEGRHALYRVLQESLSNALRHGQAGEVSIRLGCSEEEGGRRLWMSVEDDGCGFDPGFVPAARETGLAGMSERMRALGGDLDVRSVPGGGTTVRAALEVD